jgi:hypothetical protein
MARWDYRLAGWLALAALCSGCAANRPANPFGWTKSKSSASQLAKKSTDSESESTGARDYSDGRNPALAATKGARSTRTPDDDSRSNDGRTDPATSKSANDGGHDPETMAYIDQQLRDATPEERTALLAELKGLHPEAVRQILRGRRMAINHERQVALATQRSQQPGAIQPTAGEVTAAPGIVRLTDASQSTPLAGPWSNLPVGHSSGYRADAQARNPTETNYAALPSNVTAAGRGSSSSTQPLGNPQSINPDAATTDVAIPRDASVKPASVAIGAPMNAAFGPATAGAAIPGDGATRDQLARLISAVEAEAAALQPGDTEAGKHAYIEKQVHLRMLYLMSGQQERALQAIPGLDPADQEFWQQTFWGLTNYFDTDSIPSSAERAAQTVTQLTNAVLRLQEKANLDLRNVTFCHKISGFGSVEKYPREEFSPGQEVLLYAEVANTHSEPIPDGKFRTSLKSTIEVYRHGSQGEMIERVELPETVDICRTHRRDYFHSYQYTIPTKLTLGPHLLKLTVEDQLSRRVATYTLNFTVK